MNFYPFNIGDYAGKTRHLTWDEDMAYRRLLDVYYSTEAPLPKDKRQIYRLTGAQTARQKQAIDTVLIEFFSNTTDGYSNARCDQEIAKAQAKKEKAKQSAEKRWGGEPHSEGNANACANAMRTHCEGNAPNPNPNPNIGGVGSARATVDDLEQQLRQAAGWQNEPAPMLHVTGEIQTLIDNGADLHLDVLPVVQALAPDASRTSWRYFVKAIARQRDQRISAATVVSLPTATSRSPSHAANRQNPPRSAIFEAIHASIDRAEGRAAADGS